MRAVVVDVLLALAVAITLVSSLGVLVMRDALAKVHYVTPVSMIAPVLLATAVLVQTGYSSRSAQSWLAVLFLLIASPFLSHATIRAARIRAEGDWRGGGSGGGRAGDRGDSRADGGGRR
jgi:multisubunit Na+/H+ antiporter MnhG subunit